MYSEVIDSRSSVVSPSASAFALAQLRHREWLHLLPRFLFAHHLHDTPAGEYYLVQEVLGGEGTQISVWVSAEEEGTRCDEQHTSPRCSVPRPVLDRE
jgi:hypothetical protein